MGFTGRIMGFTPLGKEQPVLRSNPSVQRLGGHRCLRGVRGDWSRSRCQIRAGCEALGGGLDFSPKAMRRLYADDWREEMVTILRR